MPETGLEPVQDKSYQILSLGRLPFRHSGIYNPQKSALSLRGDAGGDVTKKYSQLNQKNGLKSIFFELGAPLGELDFKSIASTKFRHAGIFYPQINLISQGRCWGRC